MKPNKNKGMPLSEVVAKLKSNDPAFTELDLQKGGYNMIHLSSARQGISMEVAHFNDEILLEIAAAIQANQTLKRFIFAGVTRYNRNSSSTKPDWTHISTEAIGNALKDHPALEEIHLFLDQQAFIPTSLVIRMTSAEMSGIFQALSGKAKIKNLHLTANLTDELFKCLEKPFASNTTLESITILPSDPSKNDEYKEDSLLPFVAGFAGKFLQHLNLKLRLNDASTKILSQHLSKINTLKTLKLNRCNITHANMIFITNILNKNPNVTELDLSGNPLGASGIKSLASALPNLPQLKTLLLNGTKADDKALEALAETWQKFDLKIHTLEIGMHDYSEAYIAAIKKIIENNRHLKTLIMKGDTFKKEHFYQLQDLLQDPNKCRLQQFVFGGNLTECDDNFYNLLINILERNPNLTKLDPLYSPRLSSQLEFMEFMKKSASLTTAWKTNVTIQKNSQQRFVEKVILFSTMYFSPSEHTTELNIFSLPPDAFLLILYHLGLQEAFGKYDEDVFQCARLIFENFSTRRKLIDKKEYSPIKEINSTSKAEVSKWWSLSSRENRPKQIFQEHPVKDSKAEVNQDNSGPPTLQG